MSMFPHTITVMNMIEDDDGKVYVPCVIKGVLYVKSNSVSKTLYGTDNTNKIMCTIPFSSNQSKPFIDALDYGKLSDRDKRLYFTLRKDDIIIKGEVSDTELSSKTAHSTYNDSFTVGSVDTFDFGSLKHWQVGGA